MHFVMPFRNISIVNHSFLLTFPAGKLSYFQRKKDQNKQKLSVFRIYEVIDFRTLCFRVNLIGEHIDYCGYPVLPMAVEQSILLAVAPSDDRCLHITNTNERYKPLKCSIDNVTYVNRYIVYRNDIIFYSCL